MSYGVQELYTITIQSECFACERNGFIHRMCFSRVKITTQWPLCISYKVVVQDNRSGIPAVQMEIRIPHTTTSGTIFTPTVAYPNDGIEFTSGDLFSSLHCCSYLLLVLGMRGGEERETGKGVQ